MRSALAIALLCASATQASPDFRQRGRTFGQGSSMHFRALPSGGGGSLDCAGIFQGSWGEATTTTTRATSAWCTKGDGTVVVLGNNVPRIEPAGFFAEPTVTNIALRSEEFDNATWQKITAGSSPAPVVTADSAECGTAPDGTQTADKVVFGAIDADPNVDATVLRQLITYTAAQYATCVYGKTISGTAVIYAGVSSGGDMKRMPLTTTWREFCQEDKLLTAAGRNFHIGLDSFAAEMLADMPQSAQTVCLWGAHSALQFSSTSGSSSYIKTQGTTVVRNTDNFGFTPPTMPGASGSIAVDYVPNAKSGVGVNGSVLWDSRSGTGAGTFILIVASGALQQGTVDSVPTSDIANTANLTWTEGQKYRVAIAWSGTTSWVYRDNVLLLTRAGTAKNPTGQTAITIGTRSDLVSASSGFGWFSNVCISSSPEACR